MAMSQTYNPVQVLRKEGGALGTLPTDGLTTSEPQAHIDTSYLRRANFYLTPLAHLDDFESHLARINDFWLTLATLPPRISSS
jgi:hypothetical protein